MTDTIYSLNERMRALAQGKLKCECGNDDWTKFLYVSIGSATTTAGCKLCARVYLHENGFWRLLVSPPRPSDFLNKTKKENQ